MDVPSISVGLNVLLVVFLVYVVVRAKARLLEEKEATFAGCLGAITSGLSYDDIGDRAKMTALGLGAMRGDLDYEEFQWRITRASFLRSLRGSSNPALADVGGEHLRSLTLTCINTPANVQEAELVWNYIEGALDRRDGFQQEPRERFGDKGLSTAQYQLEAEIFALYRRSLEKAPPKLFG